jgi:heme exporter protein C
MAISWYRYASPATFLPVAERLAPAFAVAAALLALAGLYVGFVVAPTDATQDEAYRIIYIHVPTAWMAPSAGCMQGRATQ